MVKSSGVMEKSLNSVLSELLINTFNNILTIEEYVIKKGPLENLTVTEIHTIDAIGMYKARSMSDIVGDLSITIGTLSTGINNLVRKGYVTRKRDEKDRRVVNISLTRQGKIAYRVHEKFHLDMIKETIKELTEEEEKVLLNSLEKLTNYFQERYPIKVEKE